MPPAAKPKAGSKPLTAAMEDYLEAIYDLDQEKKVVRVRDIANRLDVKMPTVTSMLKTLSARALVHYEKYEYVELTTKGNRLGREIHRRHQILYRFLTDILSVRPKTADMEACKMEHALSGNTLERITCFMDFIQQCPRTGASWLEHFEAFQESGEIPEDCAFRAVSFAKDLKAKPSPKKGKSKKG
jgi:DtxR family Mn-dependent transcriptional regulator